MLPQSNNFYWERLPRKYNRFPELNIYQGGGESESYILWNEVNMKYSKTLLEIHK